MARRKTYPGNIEERGSSIRARLMVDGEMHRYTLNGATKKDAREFLREKKQELEEQAERRSNGLPASQTFSELVERYETDELPGLVEGTQKSYRDCLKPIKTYFVEELDDPRVADVGAGHIRQYMAWRRTHGPNGSERDRQLSARTVEKDRTMLHRLFELAHQWGVRDGNPVSRTDPPNTDSRDPVILDQDQYERLLSACEHSSMLHTYVLFLGETGARSKSEALWVRWKDLDLDEGFVYLDSDRGKRNKTGKGRSVPLTARLGSRLREHVAEFRDRQYSGGTSPWVFHHTNAVAGVKPGDRRKDFRGAFNRACEEADLPEGFTRHDLRHRRVTTWLSEGHSPELVRKAMGHSTLQTTLKYTHLDREPLRQLV